MAYMDELQNDWDDYKGVLEELFSKYGTAYSEVYCDIARANFFTGAAAMFKILFKQDPARMNMSAVRKDLARLGRDFAQLFEEQAKLCEQSEKPN